jgi:hypothetical protein
MRRNRCFSEPEVRVPQPAPAAGMCPRGFMLVPTACLPGVTATEWAWQQYAYRCAFAEADAVVRPSLPERDLLAVWN